MSDVNLTVLANWRALSTQTRVRVTEMTLPAASAARASMTYSPSGLSEVSQVNL